MARTRKYAMVIDTRQCVACGACVIACKSENDVPNGYCRDWVDQITTGIYPHLTQVNRSERCHHCDNAPCVTNCPTAASHYSSDGTIQVNKSMCSGCKACLAACPYDARFVHPIGYVDKCTFCQHRLMQGAEETACTEICPTNALTLVDLNSLDGVAAKMMKGRKVTRDKLHLGTNPNLYWLA